MKNSHVSPIRKIHAAPRASVPAPIPDFISFGHTVTLHDAGDVLRLRLRRLQVGERPRTGDLRLVFNTLHAARFPWWRLGRGARVGEGGQDYYRVAR